MASYRLFKLYRSATDTTGPLWRDLGVVDLEIGDDPAAVVGDGYGKGEFLLLDASLTVVDFQVA